MGLKGLASSVCPCFVKPSPTVMLQSGPTHSLVAKFPQHSVITCSKQILSCKGRTLQTRPRTDMCEPLMPDVVVPKAQQNNHSYVSSADLPSDSLCKNFVWWVVTQRTLKNYKSVKIGGWVLAWVWALARDNTVVTVWCVVLCKSYQLSSCGVSGTRITKRYEIHGCV